jgi:hypothetical protein
MQRHFTEHVATHRIPYKGKKKQKIANLIRAPASVQFHALLMSHAS